MLVQTIRTFVMIGCLTSIRLSRAFHMYGDGLTVLNPASSRGIFVARSPLYSARSEYLAFSYSKKIQSLLIRAGPVLFGAGAIWGTHLIHKHWLSFSAVSKKEGGLTSKKLSGSIRKSRSDQSSQKALQSARENEAISDPHKTAIDMNGVFVVNKPANWTSFDVVNKIRGTLGSKLRSEYPNLSKKESRVKVLHNIHRVISFIAIDFESSLVMFE